MNRMEVENQSEECMEINGDSTAVALKNSTSLGEWSGMA
jgi:hypothetical protein